MRGVWVWVLVMGFIAPALFPLSAGAQEETFRWIDFHAEKDQPIVVWVTRSLDREKWSAIREIGVFYDAALVNRVGT